ncbi:XRE family transcriptional regulator [Flavobacterium sp.]|uniref:XRE family transcriptional regulator n=1 Tax=Flavobacterium sp. TaxID=239 RepID=UPI0040332E90
MSSQGGAEIKLLNLQIGCVLRLARLKKGLSQHSLSLSLGSNSTMVGRIERAENISGWDRIFLICQHLDVDFCSLFKLKSKDDLLAIVDESYKLEDKLTIEKAAYYNTLKKAISKQFD